MAPTFGVEIKGLTPAIRAAIGGLGGRVLLYFDAKVASGIGPVSNQNWHGHVIELANVRVGTPKELAEAEVELARMPELGKQLRLAIESEQTLRITEAARIEAARVAAESEGPGSKFEESLEPIVVPSGNEEELSTITQQLSSIDAKISNAEKKPVTTPEKSRLSTGVYVGGGIAIVGVLIYVFVFMLDGGPWIAKAMGLRR